MKSLPYLIKKVFIKPLVDELEKTMTHKYPNILRTIHADHVSDVEALDKDNRLKSFEFHLTVRSYVRCTIRAKTLESALRQAVKKTSKWRKIIGPIELKEMKIAENLACFQEERGAYWHAHNQTNPQDDVCVGNLYEVQLPSNGIHIPEDYLVTKMTMTVKEGVSL